MIDNNDKISGRKGDFRFNSQGQPLTEVMLQWGLKYQKELTLKKVTDFNYLPQSPLGCELPDSRAHDLFIILTSTTVFDSQKFQIHKWLSEGMNEIYVEISGQCNFRLIVCSHFFHTFVDTSM